MDTADPVRQRLALLIAFGLGGVLAALVVTLDEARDDPPSWIHEDNVETIGPDGTEWRCDFAAALDAEPRPRLYVGTCERP